MSLSAPQKSLNRFGPFLIMMIQFTTLMILHIKATRQNGLPILFGDQSEAIFDLWSLQHLASGVLIGALIALFPGLKKKTWKQFGLIVLMIALAWEALELTIELGWFGKWLTHWKDGFEHWGNRFIGDPAMVVIGGLLAQRYKIMWKIMAAWAALWLIINLIAPNSMYIQQLITGS